jgi:hypothetical protein
MALLCPLAGIAMDCECSRAFLAPDGLPTFIEIEQAEIAERRRRLTAITQLKGQ